MRILCNNKYLWSILYDTKWSTRQPASIVPVKANFKQRATLRHAIAPIEKLHGDSYPDETYTFLLTVTCGSQTLFHGEHTLPLRDDNTKLPSLVITNTIPEANQSLPSATWSDMEDLEGRLVLIRDSDQAMALVWSLPPQSDILFDGTAVVFGETDYERGLYGDDVGHAARERDSAILEHRNVCCGECFESRHLLLISQLTPLNSNDIARGFASSTIEPAVSVETHNDVDRKMLASSRDFISCLAVSDLKWHPFQRDALDSLANAQR